MPMSSCRTSGGAAECRYNNPDKSGAPDRSVSASTDISDSKHAWGKAHNYPGRLFCRQKVTNAVGSRQLERLAQILLGKPLCNIWSQIGAGLGRIMD